MKSLIIISQKTTNAYTEGIHNHFERIKRNHFGIRNIERFLQKVTILPDAYNSLYEFSCPAIVKEPFF